MQVGSWTYSGNDINLQLDNNRIDVSSDFKFQYLGIFRWNQITAKYTISHSFFYRCPSSTTTQSGQSWRQRLRDTLQFIHAVQSHVSWYPLFHDFEKTEIIKFQFIHFADPDVSKYQELLGHSKYSNC